MREAGVGNLPFLSLRLMTRITEPDTCKSSLTHSDVQCQRPTLSVLGAEPKCKATYTFGSTLESRVPMGIQISPFTIGLKLVIVAPAAGYKQSLHVAADHSCRSQRLKDSGPSELGQVRFAWVYTRMRRIAMDTNQEFQLSYPSLSVSVTSLIPHFNLKIIIFKCLHHGMLKGYIYLIL